MRVQLSRVFIFIFIFSPFFPSNLWAQALRISDGVGITEWEEWSFADKTWWASVDDQNRSQFALASGKIAIADPDEWDDVGGPASKFTYNTQLLSPEIDISSASSLLLEFASSWRPEGFQKASVDIIFDGGAPQELFRWTSASGDPNFHADATSELVSKAISKSGDPSTMRLAFNLFDAGNNWWWAIDNVKVLDGVNPLFFEDFESVTLGDSIDELGDGSPTPNVYSQTGPAGWIVNTANYFPPGQQVRPPHGRPPLGEISITYDLPPQPAPLKLQVDPLTGHGRLLSLADEDVRLSSYEISSTLGAIAEQQWLQTNLAVRRVDSLTPPGPGQQWEVVASSAEFVFEAFLNTDGGSVIAPGDSLSLGKIYDPGVGGQDLEVEFTAFFTDFTGIVSGQSTANEEQTAGFMFLPVEVEYVSLPGVEGDFDSDGDVDGRDFLVWQRGGSPTPFSPADLQTWQANYATAQAVAHPIPEPTVIVLLSLGMGAASYVGGRRNIILA